MTKINSEFQFKVGDILEVIEEGAVYPSYDRMFEEMGFADTEENEGHDHGTMVQVFAVDHHPDFEDNLYAVRDVDGKEALYAEYGLKRIEFKKAEPKPIRVQVTNSYTAEVHKDHITVGCQTMSKEALLELIEAAKKTGLI